MIDLGSLVSVVVYLIVAGLILWLLYWLIAYVGLPEPFAKVAYVVLAIVAVLIVIGILLSLISGQPLFRWGGGPIVR
jgi:hypothetical protein